MEEFSAIRESETTIDINGGLYGALQDAKEVGNPSILPMKPKENFLSQRIPITVQWRNIVYAVNNEKTILQGVSGVAKTGELTAIMGPSGSGKTTLCNILSGLTRQKVIGQILVNDAEYNVNVYRKMCCYIMQEDYLLPHLTAQESIYFAACLKLPTHTSRQMKYGIVKECMTSLGLTDCQDVRACNLSGGQRKRLCIAQELVSNPPLIFLDEPTSGLDISSCIQCIELLKSLARQGRTIVCTIHQPSSLIYNTFDKLYMLAEGRCIYRGPTEELIPFLTEQGLQCPNYYNPADFVNEVATGKYGYWIEKLEKATNAKNSMSKNLFHKENQIQKGFINGVPISDWCFQQDQVAKKLSKLTTKDIQSKMVGGFETSFMNQFKVLTHRAFLCTIREPLYTKLLFLGYTCVGLMMGLLFYGIGNDASKVLENAGCLFFSLIFLIFAAMMSTLVVFPIEREIFSRENLNGWYDAKMYYLSRAVAELPFYVLLPVIFSSLVYWMTSQPPDLFRYGLFLCSSISITLVSQSLGYIVGASTSVTNSVFLGPVITTPLMMFCGFYIHLSAIPSYLSWFSYLSYIRYGFQGVLLIIYSMGRGQLPCDSKTFCMFQDPVDFLTMMDTNGESLLFTYAMQAVFFLVFRVAAFFVLWYKCIYTR